MELKEVLLKRRSVRKYTDEPVSPEQIDVLLHAAMSGPSACNIRPWEFYVVTSPEALEALRGTTVYTNMKAPLAIVVCGNTSKTHSEQLSRFWVQDCSAATENILLAAADMGLGTVWCGIHPQKRYEDKVAKILDLPEHLIPLNIIHVGHPDEQPEPRDQYDAAAVHFVD